MTYQVGAGGQAKGARRSGLVLLGVASLVIGVGVGIALYVMSRSSYSDAVGKLARVPVGCETDLEVDDTATFNIFIETAGTIGDLGGGCENTDTDYERRDDELPDVELTVLDGDGDEVDVDRFDGVDYDADGFVGTAVARVDLEAGSDYTIVVESSDDDFAVTLGRDPKSDADTARTIAIIVAAVGLALGALLIVLGLSRRRSPAGHGPSTGRAAGGEPLPTAFGAAAPASGSGIPGQPGFGHPPPPPPPPPSARTSTGGWTPRPEPGDEWGAPPPAR